MVAPKPNYDFKGMSVLIVDDMANMRRTVKGMLRFLGFEKISEATNGKEALDKAIAAKFDLIIADWNMPTMHGLELLQHVRADSANRTTPFVMITAEMSEAKIVAAAESEVDGYMLKPFVAKQLEEKIKSILQHRADPSPFEKHMHAGQMLMEANSPEHAIDEFEAALELRPESARAQQAVGDAYRSMGDSHKAERCYMESTRINPQFTKGYEALGDVYAERGEDAKAIENLEKATRISPSNATRQMALGKLYMKTGETEKANAALDIAIKNSRYNAALHTEIGEIFLKQGDDSRAAEAFSSSLGIDESAHVCNRLGIALRKKKKFDEALNVYNKAIKLEPENEVIHYNMSRLHIEMGNMKLARESLRTALEIDPGFTEARALLDKVEMI